MKKKGRVIIMGYYRSKESEKFHYKKQSECYQILIDSFNKIIESGVIQKFHQKVYNIKFDRALKEIFANSKVNIYINNNLQITISYHSGYSDPDDKNSGWCYLDNDKMWSVVILKENRIQSEETIKEIQDTIKQLTDSKNELDQSILNFENIQKEYEEICNKIKEFNNKYSYIVRQNYRFDRVY